MPFIVKADGPGVDQVNFDPLLTNVLIAYMQEAGVWIADRIFPVVPVNLRSAKYATYTKHFWFRDQAKLRAPGTETVGTGFGVGSGTYYCDNYATHVEVDDETRANQNAPIDVEAAALRLVRQRLQMRREVDFSTNFFKTTVWGTDRTLSGTTQWSDYANSDPIGDTDLARDTVHSTTAREINTATMGRQVWTKLRHHPSIIERIKYTQRAIVTVDLVASLFDLERILIGNGIYITSAEGAASDTYAYVWGKNVLYTFSPASVSLLEPTCGMTLTWTGMGGLALTRRLRMEPKMSDRIEGHTWYDLKAVGTDLGYFLAAAVA